MTAKKETAIWLALKSRIDTLLPAYKKAFPGQKFEAPYSNGKLEPYLSIVKVTAAPARRFIADGKPHERTGFLMITLVYPLGLDVSAYDQVAASIADHFPDGRKMVYGDVCVTVTSYPHVQDGYEDNGYWFIPVRVPWRCFV